MLNDNCKPTRERSHFTTDVEHPNHNHNHLNEIRNRYRPHATKQGVNQYAAGTNDHAEVFGDSAIRHHMKDQAQRFDLCSYPAQIGHDDAQGNQDLDGATILFTKEIANRKHPAVIEMLGKKEAYQD